MTFYESVYSTRSINWPGCWSKKVILDERSITKYYIHKLGLFSLNNYFCILFLKIFSRILVTISKNVIFKISLSSKIRNHNHLVRKRTLNHLAKLALKIQICLFTEGVIWHSGNYTDTFRNTQKTHHTNKYSSHNSII